MGTLPEGMMLTGISLAVLGFYVGLSAGFDAFEVDYEGKKIPVVPAWSGTKEWGGVWRIELRINSWVLSDYFCRKQSKQKGRLIKINTKERYNELAEALYKLSSDIPYWIGLNDRQKEGKYKWQLCKDGKGEDL